MLILIGVVITNSTYQWNEKDTTTLVTAIVLTIVVLAIGGIRKISPGDPMMKGLFGIITRFHMIQYHMGNIQFNT